ncbi:hypothetical protein [Bradyrhizobium sp. CIR3A]|uniref:hypothetical protein n=1 Tax=Bradyrhizobium sp. CIR3A TaxID=2663838 RepID=UPI0016068187|nr:hypothetical protein [Bradyrhizobium sp. CIR3A]MBB4257303.1 hypothetical protein [Bradyrhizobium sp. CIR3A]
MTATALRTDDQWYQPANTVGELVRSSFKPVVVARPQLTSPSVVHRSKWARTTVDRMMALASLRDDWDQRGSAAVRGDVLSFAWQMLSQIMPEDGKPPVIVPLGHGGVQIEWSSNGAELEVEISRPFQVSALLVEKGREHEAETDLPTDTWDRLTEVIREHFRS